MGAGWGGRERVLDRGWFIFFLMSSLKNAGCLFWQWLQVNIIMDYCKWSSKVLRDCDNDNLETSLVILNTDSA